MQHRIYYLALNHGVGYASDALVHSLRKFNIKSLFFMHLTIYSEQEGDIRLR
jgi:hypothetical protein